MAVIVEAVRLYLAIILVLAAVAKFIHREHFARAVSSYRLLPEALIVPFSHIIPSTELVLALCIGSGIIVPSSEIAAACLVSIFTGAVLTRLARGQRDGPCGCGIGRDVRLGLDVVLRNFFLIALAVAAIGNGPGETPALYLAASMLLTRVASAVLKRKRARVSLAVD